MRQYLPLSALRVFEAAARGGSFRAAAEELLLTPSAVSHAVRKLEAELAAVLFMRDGRSMALTPEGEVLLRYVERGFAELRRGIVAVSARDMHLLRLHCAPSFAAQWLTPRLGRFRRECPGIELRLAASTDYTRFVSDEFDADIVYGKPRLEGMVTLPLGEEVVTPLCAPELAYRIIDPRALLGQTLIESDNKKVRWDMWFAANGLAAPAPSGPRFDRSFLAIAAAVDGLGVALESLRLAERELASGRLVRPLAGRARDVRYVGHWLVFPPTKEDFQALRRFVDWLLAELGIGNAAPTPDGLVG
ncbi:MAG TPA: LysR substrate-binding domain-containing protein [Acetobacteraceae bacterium]|nr:LysR substrate-binding domain-containing protein [Acetobacteraceae bacterium]